MLTRSNSYIVLLSRLCDGPLSTLLGAISCRDSGVEERRPFDPGVTFTCTGISGSWRLILGCKLSSSLHNGLTMVEQSFVPPKLH